MKDDASPEAIIRRRGFMLILSSPSGAGKSTLTKHLLNDDALDIDLSISVTTRPRRSSEVDGTHYYFKTRQEFEKMRSSNDLLEWAEVHGNFYGTPRGAVEKVLASGRDMIFDIDYQGTQQVLQRARSDAVTIFILPPTMRELKARLERRAEDASDVIERRLDAARDQEISRWKLYDYVIVNRDVQEALQQVRAILIAERLRRTRSEDAICSFVKDLLSGA
jgi:guanylate kinase